MEELKAEFEPLSKLMKDVLCDKIENSHLVMGERIAPVSPNPFMETLRKKRFEVLYMICPIDEYGVQQLKDVDRMNEGQNGIDYITGERIAAVSPHPFMETLLKKRLIRSSAHGLPNYGRIRGPTAKGIRLEKFEVSHERSTRH